MPLRSPPDRSSASCSLSRRAPPVTANRSRKGQVMNTLWIVVIGVLTGYLAYNYYARRIDRNVIQSDAKRATPAKMYMDGVDFMPTSRNILFGYHFKAIAAAGPIVGPITAANIWGWSPSLAWLVLGVSFIGWVSDYSAIMVAVRNDGNSLSAIAHRLIAPRTRTILFVFIFFYLMLLAGAFIGILAAILSARPDVPFGIVVLALMGLLAGQMMYRWKMGIMGVTILVVALTVAGMAAGPWGQHRDEKGALVQGPVAATIVTLNGAVDSVSDRKALFTVEDPTMADPRVPAPGKDGKRPPLCSRVATGISWSSLGGLKGVKPPEAFGERPRDWSLGHAGEEGPHLSLTGESRGCSRAAAPVCGFSRGTTARSVSLSWGAREVGSPCEWRGGARHCSRAMGGDSGHETC